MPAKRRTTRTRELAKRGNSKRTGTGKRDRQTRARTGVPEPGSAAENKPTYREKLQLISDVLVRRGEPGTTSQIARLLDLAPSTVGRWMDGSTRPHARAAEKLDLLCRTAARAERGDEDAERILSAILGAAGARLLGLGLAGVVIAAGMSWLVSENDGDEKSGNGSAN